ncbi:MFS transporter [Skermanella pratensis]|uniref:MFS transporter n=1 Tax=Skermanella pratensis TaxID=2233999 RepID=UPI001300DDDB|nr:MFS transporter [Skermanella pratensis]
MRPSVSTAGFGGILRALRNPNYGLYTAGNAVSLIGTWMQRIAVGWLTWQLTGSGAWLGAIAFADLFPTVFVGPFAGAVADRWDRLRVTKVSQALAMVQAITLFALTWFDLMTIELLFALTVALGVIAGFNQPARLALIPSLVRREDLPAAVAINSIIFNSARFVGPAVAGLMIVTGGLASAFAVNALTFVLFLVALSRIRLPAEPPAPPRVRNSLFRDVGDGIRYTAFHEGIAPMMILLIAVCLCVRPVVELLPGFAAAVFASGAGGLAVLTSTIGAGAVLGGLWLVRRSDSGGLTGIALGNTLVLSLALLAFVSTDQWWVAIPSLGVLGACMVVTGVGTQTLLQLSVAGEMRGRVLSLYGVIFRGGPALGALIVGVASERFGLRIPLAASAGLAVLAWLWTWSGRARIVRALEPGRHAD